MTNTEKEAVRIAISLFRACAASKTPLGLAVLVNVEDALTKEDVSFGPLADGLLGEQGNDGGIIINDKLISDPAMVSVGLVHEAYHRFAHRMELYIDEEINSRQVQGHLVQNLMAGAIFEGKTYRVTEVLQVYSSYQKNQIVDWVLSMPAYFNQKDFLTQSWIVKHFKDWGGLANRNMFTKRTYVSVLAGPAAPGDIVPGAKVLFAILSAGNAADARGQITEAGGGNFATGLARVKGRIGLAMAGGAPIDFANSIVQWQKVTGIDLGVTPRR